LKAPTAAFCPQNLPLPHSKASPPTLKQPVSTIHYQHHPLSTPTPNTQHPPTPTPNTPNPNTQHPQLKPNPNSQPFNPPNPNPNLHPQIASAMAYLHSRDILHGDLSPFNVRARAQNPPSIASLSDVKALLKPS